MDFKTFLKIKKRYMIMIEIKIIRTISPNLAW